jgi:hypothetical protein
MKHVLMVGRSLEMLTKGVKHGVRYSLLCKNAPRIGLDDLQPFSRIVMLNPDADVQEWIAHARLIHERDPVACAITPRAWSPTLTTSSG